MQSKNKKRKSMQTKSNNSRVLHDTLLDNTGRKNKQQTKTKNTKGSLERPKCVNCTEELNFAENLGWIHPTNECLSEDGILVEETLRVEWNQKYPPHNPYEALLNLIYSNHKKETEKLDKYTYHLTELIESLERSVETARENFQKANENIQKTWDFRIKLKIAEVMHKWNKLRGKS